MASLPFPSWWQVIPQMVPYPFTLFEHLLAVFISKASEGLTMHFLFWHAEMVFTLLVTFFFTVAWFAMWWILTHSITYSWFISVPWYTRNSLLETSSFFLEVFRIQQKSAQLPFYQGYDVLLINNGQAANNRIPVLWYFGVHSRLMIQLCMHAPTAMNVT